jgi:hypothetical protein
MPLGGGVQIISGGVRTPPHPPENPCLLSKILPMILSAVDTYILFVQLIP